MIIMKTTEHFEANNHARRESYCPDSARLDASTPETGRPREALQRDDDAQESASQFGSEKGGQPTDTPRASAGHRIPRPVRILLILLLLPLLIGAGLAGWRYLESYQSTDDAEIDGHIHEISSRIQASVARVWVEDNQHVKKGQLLVELDPRDFQVAVEQARASLDQSIADIKVSRQNYETAVANLHATEADNYRAQRDADRYRELLTQQVVAQSEFDQYYATAGTDAAKVNADRASSDSALRTIALKQAAAQAAQAALDQALLNLSYTKIYAPDDGVIGKKTVETASGLIWANPSWRCSTCRTSGSPRISRKTNSPACDGAKESQSTSMPWTAIIWAT
jgi:membrane fusion protein (multidrug efflux system)